MKYSVLCLFAIVSLAASLPARDDITVGPTDLPSPTPPVPMCPANCLWFGVYDYPHFQDCGRYYRCIHGFFFDLACEEGTSFDHRSLSCVETSASRCIFEGPIQNPPTTPPPITIGF